MENEKDSIKNEFNLREEIQKLLIESDVPEDLREKYLTLYNEYASLSETTDEAPSIVLPLDTELEPSEDVLRMYSKGHEEFYKEELESISEDDSWSLLVMRSGMYGGKSSCLFDLVDIVKSKGFETSLLISAAMGESYITGRRFRGEERKRDAKRYGNYPKQEILKNAVLTILKPDIDIVVLDEYTFNDVEEVNTLINVCWSHGKRLVLLGLDTNYLGDDLPIFKDRFFQNKLSLSSTRILNCYSYVNALDTTQPPKGRGTIRYLNIGGRWVLDLGLGQLVISKENEKLVHYYPSIETLKNILKGNSFFEYVLKETVKENSYLSDIQKSITQYLIEKTK